MQFFLLFQTMCLVDYGQRSLGLLPIVRTLKQILIKVDLSNILIVLHRLLIDYDVVYNPLRRHRRYFDFNVVICKSEMFHGFSWEIPTNWTFVAHTALVLLICSFRHYLIKLQIAIFELDSFTLVCLVCAQFLIEFIIILLLIDIHLCYVAKRRCTQRLRGNKLRVVIIPI